MAAALLLLKAPAYSKRPSHCSTRPNPHPRLIRTTGASYPGHLRLSGPHSRLRPALPAAGPPSTSSQPEAPARAASAKKLVPLGVMFFLVLYNFTILRDTKDVMVVTARGSGAEIIPFLKTWVNLPMAVGFMVAYTRLSNVLSREGLFYACMLPFLAFFAAFAFLLYPNRGVIHPVRMADRMLDVLGPSFAGPVAILRIWSFCLFYVVAELWGNVVVSLLFWGFANQITSVEEASKFYPLFGLVANISVIFSGCTVKYFSNFRKNLGPSVDGWGLSLKGMMSIVVLIGLSICCIHWIMNNFLLTDPSIQMPNDSYKQKEKMKMGVVESLKFLVKSRYIRDIATLVVSYGISINLVEVRWKSKLKAQFPSPSAYASFMGDFSVCAGIATFIMMLLSQIIIRVYGWGATAAVTPMVMLVTGMAFFSLDLFGSSLAPPLAKLGFSTPLHASIYVGALQNILSKSAKCSLFDPSKEMAYIPLDEETKLKGKAAIEVVCCPLGKSGGAMIQQLLILTCGSLSDSTPYLGVALLVIVLGWLATTRSLDLQFRPLARRRPERSRRVAAELKIDDAGLPRRRPQLGMWRNRCLLGMACCGGRLAHQRNLVRCVDNVGLESTEFPDVENLPWIGRRGWKWIGA